TSWSITSFAEVERIRGENPVDADLPLAADTAVIMYTSGSTGLLKGSNDVPWECASYSFCCHDNCSRPGKERYLLGIPTTSSYS
ncbi:hypothetical protein MKX01_029565, partial [Papaver californicum]